MIAGSDGPFRVRVVVEAEPAVIRRVVPADPAVIRLPVPGPMGPPGRDGLGTTLSYPIASVASFTANHGLPYTPKATILDANGEQVDTDTYFAPGQVTVVFATPFTGTLNIG
jgi:hypothetical protein